MPKSIKSGYITAILITILIAGGHLPISQPVFAQDTAALEEVVVTARKREESLQDTPISITAFSGAALERQHIGKLDDIARFTPNLVLNTGTNFSGSNAAAATYIRGIGQIDFTLTTEPGVGIYLDGVYIATSIGSVLDLVDIERVEVLRGPQGTLFGRNTIGGAINVTSRQPDDELHGNFKVTTGRYDRIDARGSLNIPLTDSLFAKVTAATFNRDGFVDTPNAQNNGKLGEMDQDALRGMVRYVPNERFEATLSGDYSRARENAPPHVRVAGFEGASLALIGSLADPSSPDFLPPPAPLPAPSFTDLHNILATTPLGQEGGIAGMPGVVPNPVFGQPVIGPDDNIDIHRDNLMNPSTMDLSTETDIWGIGLTWSYDFGRASLKSITSYRQMEALTAFDQASLAQVVGQLVDVFDSEQFSQELQLSGVAMDGRLDWLVGFYHFLQDGVNLDDVEFTPARFLSGAKIDNRSTAGFAQITYDVTDKFAVTLGGRFTDERKKFIVPDTCFELPKGPATLFDGTVVTCARLQSVVDPKVLNPGFLTFVNAPVFPDDPNGRLCCLPISNAEGEVVGLVRGLHSGFELLPGGTTRQTFSDWTPHVNLAYHWAPELMTYFSFSEGFKSGGFVQRVFPPKNEVPLFGLETASVFELGAKWSAFDNRLNASAATFLTLYDDLQIQINDGIAPVTRNAAEAEIKGFELELTAIPASGWLVQGGVGFLDAEYTELDPSEDFVTDLRAITLDSELPNAPEWSTNLSVQYEYLLPNIGGRIVGRADWSYRSEIFHDALNFPQIRQPAIHLLDLTLTYVSRGERWELSAFGKNVTDKRYLVSGFANGLTQGQATAVMARPAEWGLSLAYRFGN